MRISCLLAQYRIQIKHFNPAMLYNILCTSKNSELLCCGAIKAVATKYMFYKYLHTGISCGLPPKGIGTQDTAPANLLYQDTYNYSCLPGYETNDDITTECLANGSFSLEITPTCISMC